MSGDLMVVPKEHKISTSGFANGGFNYAVPIDVDAFRRDWERYFVEVYGKKVDLFGIALPPLRQDFRWGVVRLPELSGQRMLDVLKRFDGKIWQWCTDVDTQLDLAKEARTTADGPYVTWHRDRVEADEELKNLSATDLTTRGINCITMSERIELEGWFQA